MTNHWANAAQKLGASINGHTIPIFRRKDGEPVAHGTGILLTVDGEFYLLSAAHVLEPQYIDEIVIPTGSDTWRKIGTHARVSSSIPVGKTREDDMIDVAVVKFGQTLTLDEIKSYHHFLDIDKIDFDHSPDRGMPKYVIFGYPEKGFKFEQEINTIDMNVFVYSTRISEFDKFGKYNCNEQEHIFVDYPKRLRFVSNNNQLKKSQLPNGLSGCGLWYIDEEFVKPDQEINYKLVAIMFMYKFKYHRVLIGTKMKYIKAILQGAFKHEMND